MDTSVVTLHLQKGRKKASVEGVRVAFSAHQCFHFDGGGEERAYLEALADHLMGCRSLAVWGAGLLWEALLEVRADLGGHVLAVIGGEEGVDALPPEKEAVFLAETRALARMQKRQRLDGKISVIEPGQVADTNPDIVPACAWVPMEHNIYPIHIPDVSFEDGLDMILMDCPARNLALMPNGLAYVHNVLKKTPVKFQTFDLDIIAYHRFHIQRLFDEGGVLTLPSGRVLPTDPWQAEHYDLWSDEEVLAYFEPLIDEAARAVIAAKPKILGLSIQQCNEGFTRALVQKVKKALPDTIILTGGFSCYNADIGFRGFPEADYMCIGESDLTVSSLVEALVRGETPKNRPGVLSRLDDPGFPFIPAPMPHNLDHIDFPRYEWFGIDIYRNYNDYQLTPVIASRGCRWSRCTFCAERFYWRVRTAENFVDELEWLIGEGCTLFMFNESDLNGMPERVLEICDEIIRRGIQVKLTGQLRIHKKSDRAFYDKLRAAGFVALRFGVDAFSKNTLRLQKKGYTVETISQNLKDCWEAGIYTEVNWVIGVPGETDDDIHEGIDLILSNQKHIGRLANINPLILSNGSVYWLKPDKHNIKFRRSKEELYREYPRALPADTWYSEEPFIDAQVRKDWFERIVVSLYDAGFDVGAWATRIIKDVKLARDSSRAAGTKVSEDAKTSYPSGQYDAQDAQKASGSDMRVDSLAAQENRPALSLHPRIIRFGEETLAVDGEALTGAFDGNAPRAVAAVEPPALQGPQTGLRRLATLLPARLQWKLLGLFKRERSRRGTGTTYSGLQVVSMILRGMLAEILNGLFGVFRGGEQEKRAGQPVDGEDFSVSAVIGSNVAPSLMCSIGDYNIVQFDGLYYCVPHGIYVQWDEGGAEDIPGVRVAKTVKEAMRMLEGERQTAAPRSGALASGGTEEAREVNSGTPYQLQEIMGYNLVAYEGWFYGIPKDLGKVNLTETDVMEIPGVIRDVSRDAVESEIFDRVGINAAAGE